MAPLSRGGKPRIGQKLKEEMTHIKELCKHMDIEINGSDLMKKTDYIFAVTHSFIVEAKTVT